MVSIDLWNNFFHGLFSLRDIKFANVRNYIAFKSIKKKQQQQAKPSRAQIDEIFNAFDTLEENGNRQIELRMNERNYPLEIM